MYPFIFDAGSSGHHSMTLTGLNLWAMDDGFRESTLARASGASRASAAGVRGAAQWREPK